MSNEASISQDAVQFSDKTAKITPNQKTLQDLIDSLRSVQDDIGQISELSAEEKTLVAEFFGALLKLMQPLAATIAVSIEALPEELGTVVQANIDPTGHLAILHRKRASRTEKPDRREKSRSNDKCCRRHNAQIQTTN